MMKNITQKLLFAICIAIGLHSCGSDDSSLVEGRPDSIVNNDPDGAPPRALVEDWSDHDEVLNRQILNGFVGIYFDPEVDRTSEWTFDFFGNIWPRTLSIYGRYGEPSSLYVVGHGEDKSTYYGTYLEAGSGKRNIIDFPLTSTEFDSQTADQALALLAGIVETAYGNNSGAPASGVWNSKFAEIFIYDMYLSQGLDVEAERVKAEFEAKSETFPSADSYWFRDWLFPIYETYNQEATFNAFFNLIKTYYPADAGTYVKTMTVGEFVHFFSGATGVNLKSMFEDAFGWDTSYDQELLMAQAQFPDMPYSFPPASETIDVTGDGNAEIFVTSEWSGGKDGREGSSKLIDNDFSSKFLTDGFPKDFYMQQNFMFAQVANKYIMVSGNDAPERDFRSWELQGSNDGTNFTLLHKVTDENFTERNQRKEYSFDNTTAYNHYRIVLLANNGSSLIQLSEWRMQRLQLLTFGPQDVTASAITTVSRENRNGADSNEASFRVTDGDTGTKFLLFNFNNPEWIQQEFQNPVRVTKYSLTSANDAPGRDPVEFTLSGSNDGVTFTEIDSRTGQSWDSRGLTREFLVTNENSYKYYRLDILANGGDGLFQLAEWRLFAE